MLRRLDADRALAEEKRAPLQEIDLVAAQARHRAEQKNLEQLGVLGGEFFLRALDQCDNVERRAVAWRRDALSLDAGKGNRVGDLDDIANARQRVGEEERLGAQDQAAGGDGRSSRRVDSRPCI